MMKSLIPRKFRIGQKVKTKSGLIGVVIGSALYGVVDGKITPFTHVVYRVKIDGHSKTLYRKETELNKP